MKSSKIALLAKLMLLTTLSAVVATPSSYADSPDYFVNQVNFEHNKQHAITALYNRGYQVHEVQLENQNNKPILQIYALKNGSFYDIKMDYPSLKIISEKKHKK